MAKSENPIDSFRRQQRKKELKKNKSSRIKARDAKVAATLSVEHVKTEISLLERKRDRNDEKTGLDAIETKKLERLQKELRIVSAESIKRKALIEEAQIQRDKELLEAQKTVDGVQKLNESKYSLVERYASVYYDERMNPFGAPEPGKPKLYFADEDAKATTMDSRRAVVPKKWREKFDLERGPDKDELKEEGGVGGHVAKKRRWDDRGDTNNQQMMMPPPVNHTAVPGHYAPPPPSAFPPPPPPQIPLQPQMNNNFPPPPHHPMQMPPPPPPPPMPHQLNRNVPPPPPPPVPPPPPPLPPNDTNQPPTLPAPSKAVLRAAKRGGKRNAMADIWASQEEMQYEQQNGKSMAMEGTLDQQQPAYLPRWKRHKKKNAQSKEIADVNDPCCPSADGYGEYRNKDQIERQSKEVAMLQKEQNEHVAQHLATHLASTTTAAHAEQQSAVPFYNVQQSIWYYRDNTSGGTQGPFSGEQMMGWRAFFPATTPVRFGEGGEFVALGEVDFVKPPVPPPPPPPPPPVPEMAMAAADPAENDTTNGAASAEHAVESLPEESEVVMPPLTAEDDGVKPAISEAEIAAAEPPTESGATGGTEVEMCVPPEDDENDVDVNDEPEVDMCLPPPSDDEEADGENDVDGKDGGEVDMCLPPPSDDEQELDQSEVPYPEVGAYPLPSDDDAVPYPMMEYPVDDDDAYAYPNTSDAYGDAPGEMAAVAPYPSTDDVLFGVANDVEEQTGEQGVMPPIEEKKKEFKGDKAVVGFVPTHLRVKRKVVAKPTKKKPTTLKEAPQQGYAEGKEGNAEGKEEEAQGKYSVADDYNKFMEEISELK